MKQIRVQRRRTRRAAAEPDEWWLDPAYRAARAARKDPEPDPEPEADETPERTDA